MLEQYSNMRSATSPSGSAQTGLPRINVPAHIKLTDQEKTLLQHVHQGCKEVLVEKELRGGMSGARVLLILPILAGGISAARKVTKLDLALELRQEQDSYDQYVKDFLPYCTAQVRDYYEQDDQAGLNYTFVGGGALGNVMDLQEYYRTHTAEQVIETLDALLDQELGQRWYGKSTPLDCFFAAEYSRHMVAHLQLELRPASSDVLWPSSQPPDEDIEYQRIAIDDIPREHGSIQPDTLLAVEGLVVAGAKPDSAKLEDPGGQDVFVRVKFPPGSGAAQGLQLGSIVGVRGRVVHNRRERMKGIAHDIFRRLSLDVDSERIELPDMPGVYPNPLKTYPTLLSKVLEGRASFVHGDLHSFNVLVNVLSTGLGQGWLIDFARVEKRHNLFDFIELETYLRLKELGSITPPLSLEECAWFEEALNAATLGQDVTPPADPRLLMAYQVILAIRKIARKYMGPHPDFRNEYFPALFLYCLAVMKYYRNDGLSAARCVFITACVLNKYILGIDDPAGHTASDVRSRPSQTVAKDRPTMSTLRDTELTWTSVPVRQLLTAAFDDEQLTRFCYDHFRPVSEEFSVAMSKGQKVQRLLDYCERHCKTETLLKLIKESNPAQYARFASQR